MMTKMESGATARRHVWGIDLARKVYESVAGPGMTERARLRARKREANPQAYGFLKVW